MSKKLFTLCTHEHTPQKEPHTVTVTLCTEPEKIMCNEIRFLLQLYSVSVISLSRKAHILVTDTNNHPRNIHNIRTHKHTHKYCIQKKFNICFIMGCALINNVGLAVLPFFS